MLRAVAIKPYFRRLMFVPLIIRSFVSRIFDLVVDHCFPLSTRTLPLSVELLAPPREFFIVEIRLP